MSCEVGTAQLGGEGPDLRSVGREIEMVFEVAAADSVGVVAESQEAQQVIRYLNRLTKGREVSGFPASLSTAVNRYLLLEYLECLGFLLDRR